MTLYARTDNRRCFVSCSKELKMQDCVFAITDLQTICGVLLMNTSETMNKLLSLTHPITISLTMPLWRADNY